MQLPQKAVQTFVHPNHSQQKVLGFDIGTLGQMCLEASEKNYLPEAVVISFQYFPHSLALPEIMMATPMLRTQCSSGNPSWNACIQDLLDNRSMFMKRMA